MPFYPRPGSGGTGAVSSVAGRTGDVALTKTDVGLSNVDNTTDATKPVSTAQAAADALALAKASNLSDLANAGTARTNLGVAIGSQVQAYNAQTALRTDKLSAFAATTSAELLGTISDETGTGALVFGTAPTLSNPMVGTQTTADSSTKAASTAFVQGEFGRRFNATTTDPTVNSDNTAGYVVTATWINTTTRALFRLTDATTGAAIWVRQTADVQVFTADGTWTKPAWATTVVAAVIGGGGGGGGGARQVSGSACSGGGGGGGGSWSGRTYQATTLGATESVTVGQGGAGGAAQTTNSTAGNSGVAGGQSLFGSYLRATATTAGQGGQLAASSTGGTNGSGMTSGGAGGAGGNGAVGAAGSGGAGASGGGAGGGISTTPTAFAGGHGSASTSTNGTTNAAGGAATGAAGTAGYSMPTGQPNPGNGGGGGGASITVAGGTGGAGGTYGGGGGGGGSSLNGTNGGAGGAGGNGVVVVISQ